MNIQFFGGADEVGASCTMIEIEEKRILVEAGIRMNIEPGEELPDFEALWQTGLPHVILLTHAHTDHTGALPELEKMLAPNVKIYCTHATRDITEVLLNDAAKRSKVPDFRVRVSYALHRMECVGFNQPIEIYDGLKATWIPAGHILGAAMIHIQGEQESVLMTGDVSSADQLTIPGMAPPPLQPDVMVMESTYGNRKHKNRRKECRRLVSDVAKTIDAGGKVLIPAFAVGRSQEVIRILKDAMEHGDIPKFPVYVDGMVRDINTVYERHPELLSRRLRRQMECGENIFYSGEIRKVSSPNEYDSILSGPPCCIVASSGMLVGGKSIDYLKGLANDPANLIVLSGYQAEGNPGRALEDLAKEKDPYKRELLPLNDKTKVRVLCGIERYSLSAHADKKQLTNLEQRVQPSKHFLVHGDEKARKELSRTIRERCPAVDVKLPKNGETYTVKQFPGIADGRKRAHDEILKELRDSVVNRGMKGPFTARALSEIWFGTKRTTRKTVDFLRLALTLPNAFFVPRPDSADAYEVKSQ